ncbi:MAG: hypothetical protein JO003_00840 [Candidatus Eremiobacteraeota bacterium]|nr:hypothetical protein [Candidatus Eremiobacteraeota bacterium]
MPANLESTVRAFVKRMTSIRGRRVQRLLLRDFARFNDVFPVAAEDGGPALLGIGEDGRVAICRTDGRGASAPVAEWARLDGATVTIAYDLLKDSLPIISWTLWHPSFTRAAGALTISAGDVARSDHARVTELLRSLGK